MFTTFISMATTSAAGNGRVLSFPPQFLWGTGTSPTQVEGHITNEWTHHVARDGRTCHPACDSYHRYPEDIEWMVRLGVKGYRMGIEWSRLQAGPCGPLNQAELARYLDQLDRLQAAGITPMVVLHHFSNPLWIIGTAAGKTRPRSGMFVDYRVQAGGGAARPGAALEHVQRAGHLRLLRVSDRGISAVENKWRFLAYRRVIRNMAAAHVRVCRLLRQAGSSRGRWRWGFPRTGRRLWPTTGVRRGTGSLRSLSHEIFNRFVLRSFSRRGRAGRRHVSGGQLLRPGALPAHAAVDPHLRVFPRAAGADGRRL